MKKNLFCGMLLWLIAILPSQAATITWIGTTTSWNVGSNWSGGVVPGVGDVATFTNTANCTVNTSINILGISLNGYTGTLTQGSGNTITLGASGFTMNGGTFTGGTVTITTGSLSISGGTFNSTSGTLNVGTGGYSKTGGTFNAGTGTVSFGSTCTITGSTTFNNLTFLSSDVGAVTVTISSGTVLTANGTLKIQSGGANLTINTGDIYAKGNITQTGSGPADGSATITVNGTGAQTFTGAGLSISSVPNVVINKASGTLSLSGTISVKGNWTFTSVGTGSLSPGTSTVDFEGAPVISGKHTLNNLTVTQTCTVSAGDTIGLVGNLTIAGTSALNIQTGTINVAGNVAITNTVNAGGGTGTINLTGSATQTLTANSGSTGYLGNLTINKSGGSIVLNDTITVTGALNLKGSSNYTINNGSSGNLWAKSDVIFGSSCYSNGGTGLITIAGSGAQALTGNTGPTGRLPKVTINKSGGTLTFSNTIGVSNDWTYTAGTLSPGSSTVIFYDNLTIGGSNHTLNNVTLNNSTSSPSTITLGSSTALTVSSTLKTDGDSALYINTGGSGLVILTGTTFSVSNRSSKGGGTGTIVLSGTGTQTVTGNSSGNTGKLCNFKDDKTGGSIVLNNAIPVAGNINFTGTTLHTINNGSNGDLQAYADVIVSSTTQVGGGTGLLSFRGNAKQTLTGNAGGNGTFPNLTINKSADTVEFVNNIRVLGNFTFVAGKIKPNTGQVLIMAQGTTSYSITATPTLNLYNLSLSNNTSSSPTGTLTLIGNLSVNNIIIGASRGRFAAGSNTITVNGNWTDDNLFYPGTSTVIFAGSAASQTVSGAESPKTFYNTTFNKSATSTVTISDAITVTNTLSVAGSSATTINTGTINVTGQTNISNSSTSGGGNATVLINGSSDQNINGNTNGKGYLPNLSVNKSGGNLIVDSTITVSGTLAFLDGTSNYQVNANHVGNVLALGNVSKSSSCKVNGGSGQIEFTGSAAQTLSGSGVGKLPKVKINKSSNTLTISGTVQADNSWAYSAGTISSGTSTVVFTGTTYTVSGAHTLGNVSIAPTATTAASINIANPLTASGTLTYAGSAALAVTGTLNASGDIAVTNTVVNTPASHLLNINGTSSQAFSGLSGTGFSFKDVTISKTGTVTLSNNIYVTGNLTYTAGTVSTATTSSVIFNGTGSTINTGSVNLYNVNFNPVSAATHTISNSLNVSKTLTLGTGTVGLTLNTGTINASGDIMITSTSTNTPGSTLLNITGGATQSFSTTSTTTVVPLAVGPVNINKSNGTLTLTNNINAGGDWTYTSGSYTLDASSSNVLFTKTSPVISGSHTLGGVYFAPPASSTITVASGTNLTASGTLGFLGSSAMIINTGSISATGGTINIANTSTGSAFGNGTVIVSGTGTQTLTCATGAPIIPNFTINKASGTLKIMGSNVAIGGNYAHTTGSVSIAGDTKVSFYGNAGVSGVAADTFGVVDIAGGSRTLSSNMITRGTFRILSGSTLDLSGGSNNLSLMGDWNNQGTYTSGTGYLQFVGPNNQNMTEPSGGSISKLKIGKSGNNVTLGSPVTVRDSINFTGGSVISTTTNLLVMNHGSGAVGASSATGFVSGPIKKIGNGVFSFPVGKSSNYQPISISAPTYTTDAFTAEYFNAGQTLGAARDSSIDSLSTCEYWSLDQTAGTSSVSVTLGWNASSCDIDSANSIGYWDGSKWQNAYGNNFTGNRTAGTVTTYSPQSTFGKFILIKVNLCKKKTPIAEAGVGPPYAEYEIGDAGIALGGNPMGSGTIQASGSGPYPPYYYSWTPSSTLSGTGANSPYPLATPYQTTTYTLTIQNSLGCISRDVITFWVTQPITVLKREIEGGYYIALHGQVAFEYNEDYVDVDRKLNYTVYDLGNYSPVLGSNLITPTNLAAINGTNRYLLDMQSFSSGFYLLEVVNQKKEKFYLRFKI